MTTVRQFTCNDLFRFNFIELADFPRSVTYDLDVYLDHFAKNPEYFLVSESPSGELMGYIMGTTEEDEGNKYGHISLILNAPCYRRIGLARNLISTFEKISEKKKCWFLDLHVQVSNVMVIELYQTLGFFMHETLFGYYWPETEPDAYNMRKSLYQRYNHIFWPTHMPLLYRDIRDTNDPCQTK